MSGFGERTERGENGLTEIKDARLMERSIKWRQAEGARFATHKPLKEFAKEVEERGDVTLAEMAVIETHRLMQSTDNRTKGIGARLATQMERINQIQELAEMEADPFTAPIIEDVPVPTQNVQVNVILPDNGRGPLPEIHVNGNGHTANGSH